MFKFCLHVPMVLDEPRVIVFLWMWSKNGALFQCMPCQRQHVELKLFYKVCIAFGGDGMSSQNRSQLRAPDYIETLFGSSSWEEVLEDCLGRSVVICAFPILAHLLLGLHCWKKDSGLERPLQKEPCRSLLNLRFKKSFPEGITFRHIPISTMLIHF